ncbi:MAG: serine hydrolase [Desulfoarculaceae bacterium]|nr:serine hydrolase [Desulfoarculaceae bacterium]
MISLNKSALSQRLYAIFTNALENNNFPGAAVGISLWNGKKYDGNIYYYGLAQSCPERVQLTRDTFFDLASLTKPLATVPALLSLMEEGRITWNMNLGNIFPAEIPEDKISITIKQLMSHCSGLPAHKEYFNKLLTPMNGISAFRRLFSCQKNKKIICKALKLTGGEKKTVFKWIVNEELSYPPGEDNLYSDLGFILLGFIIEKISGENLDEYVKKKIYTPLNLQNSLFYAEKAKLGFAYAATEKCPWAGEILSGRVHDDNCRALGGVAGHAGLFGTIDGVVQWCEHLLSQVKGRSKHPSYGNELVRMAVTKEGLSGWTPGFDTPSATGSSSGRFFSSSSFGHLGFTGTSFWIDPQKELIIVLLTNRVHPNRNNELIRKFRPLFHDTVMRCLSAGQ